jgi:ribosomal-protein-alanine N-acetyltransferase
LTLCHWDSGDWREFRAIAGDPEVIRYIGDGKPWPEERSRQLVEHQIELYRERAFCLWKLLPKEGGELIGFCGLQPLSGTGDIEIGWWLARSCWGRGLATEAARAALGDGFVRVGLGRIVAIAQPANTASIHVMWKLGMHFEKMTRSRGIPVVLYSVHRSVKERKSTHLT